MANLGSKIAAAMLAAGVAFGSMGAAAQEVDHAAEVAALGGDAAKGERVFRRCKQCHEIEKDRNKVGPTLQGLFGRTAGTLETFNKYSNPMKAAGEGGLVWNAATLSEYLVKPRDYIKGTTMAFAGLKKEEDIKNVIAYMGENGGIQPATQ